MKKKFDIEITRSIAMTNKDVSHKKYGDLL
jgi:hypothetical protein